MNNNTINLTTTLKEIEKFKPCYIETDPDKWASIVRKVGTRTITIMDIYNEVGIEDAIWCLRVFDYKDYCLFLADLAESVLPIFENKFPDDKRPSKVIELIRLFKQDKTSKEDLADAADAAAADAAAYAAADAYAADDADVDAYAVYAAAYAAYAGKNKWEGVEKLFIKHFG